MASNRYLEIRDAIDAARDRLSLIREGLIPQDDDDFMPRWRGPKGRVRIEAHRALQRAAKSIPFNIPATRSYRLTSLAGATSFHFSHRSVGKVTFATCEEGVRVKPGAARAHGRYVEREEAVAILDPLVEPQPDHAISDAADLSPTAVNQEHEHDYTHDQRIDRWLGRGLVEDLHSSESGAAGPVFAGPLLGRPVEDALTDARMWLLPRRDVVRHGSGTHGILRSAADVSVEAGSEPLRLRQPSSGDRDEAARVDAPSLRSHSEASGHDQYIGRMGAVAIQPDGTRALLTNIDPDDNERARFWSLVEQHEAVNQGDKMSLRTADNPQFWLAMATRPDCPPELKAALDAAPPNDIIRFDIASGKEMRAFLAAQPGWVPPTTGRKTRGGAKPFAKFHDGRSGRTQYRIVGELPNELDDAGRFGILREFSQQFSKRRLPFVAVMHAPDHKNDERNWHFHLIYYDRPCRRITQDDIGHLTQQGYRTADLELGMWDFAVVTPKKGRSNGKAVPLKQNKVSEVTQDGWIEMLRNELAGITNRHLERADVERRVDPRRYEEMGIIADPQEHLGTNQAAAETRGEATAVGRENESRQWDAIMAAGTTRLDAALAAIDEQPGATGDRGNRQAADEAARRDQRAEAARLEHMAFCLEQDFDRARSRAVAVQRKNRQLLDAYDADAGAGTARERREAGRLVEAATDYLARLDAALGEGLALPADARRAADQIRYDAAQAGDEQPQRIAAATIAPIHAHPERFTAIVRDDEIIAAAAARLRDERREAAARTPTRPDLTPAHKEARANADGKPGRDPAIEEVITNDVAKRAAIAAALRGHGR